MDELFRPTPQERRTRRTLRLAIAGLAVLAAFIAAAVAVGKRAWKKRSEPVPPAAYLVAAGNSAGIRIDGRNARLETTLVIPAGKTVELPAGTRAIIVHPKDGSMKTIAGPETIRTETAVQSNTDKVDFLASPREILIGAQYAGPGESTGRVLVTSPFGVTRFTNPTIMWEPRPGVRYDVAVVDPDDPGAPPRIAVNVLPPVRADQLETSQERVLASDRIYNVIVREAGSETQVGGMRFLVAPDATAGAMPVAPAELVGEALRALWSKPSRTGDGWLALSRLPPDWSESELVLRLRMRAAAELGLFDEIRKIQYQLWLLDQVQ